MDAADYERWATLIELDGLIIGDDGSIRFTSKRKDELRGLFGMAGIDIRQIKTKRQYIEAREAAKAHFMPFLERRARDGKMTKERRLLLAILEGNASEADRLEKEVNDDRAKKDQAS